MWISPCSIALFLGMWYIVAKAMAWRHPGEPMMVSLPMRIDASLSLNELIHNHSSWYDRQFIPENNELREDGRHDGWHDVIYPGSCFSCNISFLIHWHLLCKVRNILWNKACWHGYHLGDLSFLSTHLHLDKMAAFSQTIFSDAFSWMKSFVFWLKFHWSLFLRVQLTNPSIGLDNGLAPKRRQAIIWTNAVLIHWHICATRGGWVKSKQFAWNNGHQ